LVHFAARIRVTRRDAADKMGISHQIQATWGSGIWYT
jgi:hypothetical protein